MPPPPSSLARVSQQIHQEEEEEEENESPLVNDQSAKQVWSRSRNLTNQLLVNAMKLADNQSIRHYNNLLNVFFPPQKKKKKILSVRLSYYGNMLIVAHISIEQ